MNKKTYIAYTFKDWKKLKRNELLIAVFRPDYIDKRQSQKVRITIEKE